MGVAAVGAAMIVVFLASVDDVACRENVVNQFCGKSVRQA